MTPTTRFCTIATRSYIPHVLVLAKSIAAQDPQARLLVLFTETLGPTDLPANAPIDCVSLQQLPDLEAVRPMLFYYDKMELCNALKPFLHEYILHHTDWKQWFYLDSDICVFGSFAPLGEQLKKSSLLLTAHANTPIDKKFTSANDRGEIKFMNSGVFNGGFLGLQRTKMTSEFVAWWKEHCRFECRIQRGMYYDQMWLNLIPALFPDYQLSREPGVNVAYWNLHERKLTRANGEILCNGRPLIFVHYSGWRITEPSVVTRYTDVFEKNPIPEWAWVGEHYARELMENHYASWTNIPYSYDHFSTGQPLTQSMRLAYLSLVRDGKPAPSSPFDEYQWFKQFAPKSRVNLAIEKATRFLKVG